MADKVTLTVDDFLDRKMNGFRLAKILRKQHAPVEWNKTTQEIDVLGGYELNVTFLPKNRPKYVLLGWKPTKKRAKTHEQDTISSNSGKPGSRKSNSRSGTSPKKTEGKTLYAERTGVPLRNFPANDAQLPRRPVRARGPCEAGAPIRSY